MQVADWKAVKVAGGLVTGQVTDDNTSVGIVGADVTAASGQRAMRPPPPTAAVPTAVPTKGDLTRTSGCPA
ncbi:hypothetical protein [Actinacidiphila sp. bgisy167]|uniref:hypothetical protein n=1 Tax=Actinacidiphila sp. bgisy167 TaxID=3413797 RepID=UPI003D756635